MDRCELDRFAAIDRGRADHLEFPGSQLRRNLVGVAGDAVGGSDLHPVIVRVGGARDDLHLLGSVP